MSRSEYTPNPWKNVFDSPMDRVQPGYKEPIKTVQPIQATQPIQPVQQAPQQPIQPIQNQANAMPPLTANSPYQSKSLSDLSKEAAKLYSPKAEDQLKPIFEYYKSQMPSLVDQATQKAFKQNVATGTGLGGQIMAKTMQEFEKNVLAPIMMKIGTEQALNLPKEQLALAQNLQNQQTEEGRYQYNLKQAEIDKNIANMKNAIETGQLKEENVVPMLSQIYGIDQSMLNAPSARNTFIDEYVKETQFNQNRTPTLEEANKYLTWLRQKPITPEEWTSMFGQQANQLKIEPTKISSFIAKLDAGQINKGTAGSDYGIPYEEKYEFGKGGWWNFRDNPQTRAKITELYTTNPDFRAWFDTNA
jgi:hypothetical protein